MFRRLGNRLSHYDWAAIVGTGLALTFALIVIVPAVQWGARPHQQPKYEHCYTTTDQPSVYKEVRCVTFWERTRDDPVAFFTFVLAIFTVALVCVSAWQGALILRSEASTRAALKTSEKHAAYTRRAVRPVIIPTDPDLVRSRGASGVTLNQILTSGGGKLCGAGAKIENRGNGLAIILGASFRYNYGEKVGPMPPVGTATNERLMIGAGSIYEPGAPLCTVIVPQGLKGTATKSIFVCGWIRYMDVFGVTRRAGYAWQFYPPDGDDIFHSDGGFVKCSEGDPDYWYEIEEPEDDGPSTDSPFYE